MKKGVQVILLGIVVGILALSAPVTAGKHGKKVKGKPAIKVKNIEQLYSAVNDSKNITLVLSSINASVTSPLFRALISFSP